MIVASFAIRIGANTVVFSVVNALLLNPLPYPNPDRPAVLWLGAPRRQLFLPEEDVPGKAPVVVLSNSFWPVVRGEGGPPSHTDHLRGAIRP